MKTNYHVKLLASDTPHERSVTKFGDEKLGIPVDVKIKWLFCENGPQIQAMTFSGDKWDKKGVKNWLKKHKYADFTITDIKADNITFTEGNGENHINMPMQKELKKETRKVPASALKLMGTVPVKFVAAKKEGDKNRFQIQANSGGIMQHWYWGNLAVDLDGLSIGREDKPVFRAHDTDRIVGWTDGFKIDPKLGLLAMGYFSDVTEDAKDVMDLAEEGFPWQASVFVPPTEVEFVEKGETVKVNGYELSGPGAVFRKTTLREVSVCALGADENTSSSMLNGSVEDIELEINVLSEKEHEMEYGDITLEALKENRADLVEQIQGEVKPDEDTFTAKKNEGAKEERERCSGILTECATFGLPESAAGLIADGSTVEEATQKLKSIKMEVQKLSDPGDPGANPDPDANKDKFAGLEGEALFKAQWEQNHNGCNDEFEEEADYVAYCKAANKGKVSVITGKAQA